MQMLYVRTEAGVAAIMKKSAGRIIVMITLTDHRHALTPFLKVAPVFPVIQNHQHPDLENPVTVGGLKVAVAVADIVVVVPLAVVVVVAAVVSAADMAAVEVAAVEVVVEVVVDTAVAEAIAVVVAAARTAYNFSGVNNFCSGCSIQSLVIKSYSDLKIIEV